MGEGPFFWECPSPRVVRNFEVLKSKLHWCTVLAYAGYEDRFSDSELLQIPEPAVGSSLNSKLQHSTGKLTCTRMNLLSQRGTFVVAPLLGGLPA